MNTRFKGNTKDIIVFCIFCIFLLYVLCLGVLNVSSFIENGQFHGLNPIEAFSKKYILITVSVYILLLFTVFMSCFNMFFERESNFNSIIKKEEK